MKNRVISDGANPVNLFPFLAVLLCTMGALLVLLVVLAERAGKRVVAEAGQPVAVAEVSHQHEPARTLPVFTAPAPTPEELAAAKAAEAKARELSQQLEAVQKRQKTLTELREKINKQLFEEQQRLAHLEDHTRRLEHELAKLHVASEYLKETESNQTVNQQQAEHELKRLKKLIEENETQLDKLQDQTSGKKSYAITPYDGKSGTSDPRIFIECTRNGIVLQPEGLEFVAKDFLDEQSPDSPLSAAVRATRGHLRQKAMAAGEPNPPYAVALFLVWPDGDIALYKARAALEAAGESYGIEYLSSKGEINYPISFDPVLAESQHHAIMIARDRLEHRIRSAPSRFRRKLERIVTESISQRQGSQSVAASGNNAGSGDFAFNNVAGNAATGATGQTGDEGSTAGWATAQLAGQSSGQSAETGGESSSAPQIGAMTGDGNSTDPNGALAGESGAYSEQNLNAQGNAGGSSGTGSQAGGAGSQAAAGAAGSAGNQTSSSGASSSASGSAAQQSQEMKGSQGARADRYASAQNNSSAESTGPSGDGWALSPKRRLSAVPLQRPIRVVIRKDFVAFLPGRGTDETGHKISTQQSPKQVSKEIVSALKNRMGEWGIAGNDLYWKPVLVLSVAPDAASAANRFKRLMKNSGVPIRASERTQMSQRRQENATH